MKFFKDVIVKRSNVSWVLVVTLDFCAVLCTVARLHNLGDPHGIDDFAASPSRCTEMSVTIDWNNFTLFVVLGIKQNL